jgi:NAD(P)-dependent dehydrogenase (short-subunit alcohol dehydrogenase family)
MAQSAPVVLVTGCGAGVGLAAAVLLAERGWRVVATVRRPEQVAVVTAAAAEAGMAVDVRELDVTRADQAAAVIAQVAEAYGRLDAVVNNAGVGHQGTLETDGLDELRRVMEVNFFGVAAVSHAALPHLRAARGRLVAVTSVAGAVGQPFNDAYCAAKHAVEGLYESLAPTLGELGVRVSIVQPGPIATDFGGKAAATATPTGDDPYGELLARYRSVMGGGKGGQSPAEVAAVIADVLAADEPPLRVQTSTFTSKLVGRSLVDLDGSRVLALTTPWVAAR